MTSGGVSTGTANAPRPLRWPSGQSGVRKAVESSRVGVRGQVYFSQMAELLSDVCRAERGATGARAPECLTSALLGRSERRGASLPTSVTQSHGHMILQCGKIKHNKTN